MARPGHVHFPTNSRHIPYALPGEVRRGEAGAACQRWGTRGGSRIKRERLDSMVSGRMLA